MFLVSNNLASLLRLPFVLQFLREVGDLLLDNEESRSLLIDLRLDELIRRLQLRDRTVLLLRKISSRN